MMNTNRMNIYRVISLSLAISLLFAAPLLCVSPISVQLKKGRRLASKKSQAERARVVQQRVSYRHIRKEARAAAWARATHRFLIGGPELQLTDEKQISTPTLLFDEEESSWSDSSLQDENAAVVPLEASEDKVASSAVVKEM